MNDFFNARDQLKVGDKEYVIYRLAALEKAGLVDLKRVPFSIRVLLEAALRQCNDKEITQTDVKNIAAWTPKGIRPGIPFLPARVVLQDFTGVPAIVDLAAMRSAVGRLGSDPKKINPLVPVDLVIDHSIQVDFFATADSLTRNTEIEFQRNRERYEFLKWGQKAFSNFRVVPPMTGIVHQVNLEYLADVVMTKAESDDTRSSLSYKLKRILRFKAAEVLCTDPYVRPQDGLVPLEEVLERADILVVGTPHKVYANLAPQQPVVDIWNIFGRGVRV